MRIISFAATVLLSINCFAVDLMQVADRGYMTSRERSEITMNASNSVPSPLTDEELRQFSLIEHGAANKPYVRILTDEADDSFYAEYCNNENECRPLTRENVPLSALIRKQDEIIMDFGVTALVTSGILLFGGGKLLHQYFKTKKFDGDILKRYAIITGVYYGIRSSVGMGLGGTRKKFRFIESIITEDYLEMPIEDFVTDFNDLLYDIYQVNERPD